MNARHFRFNMKPSPAAPTCLPPEYSGFKRPRPYSTLEKPFRKLMIGLLILSVCSVPIVDLVKYVRMSHESVNSIAIIETLSQDKSGCHVAYIFNGLSKNGEQIPYNDSNDADCSLYASLKAGQKIAILYLSSDPAVSVLKSQLSLPLGEMIFLGVFGITSLYYVFLGLSTMRRLRQLRKDGQQTEAIIFDRWKIRVDDSATFLVAYAFKASTSQGQQIITRAEENKEVYEYCHVGDALTVCYLPEKPEKVCRIIFNKFSKPLREEDYSSNFKKVTDRMNLNSAILIRLLLPFSRYPFR